LFSGTDCAQDLLFAMRVVESIGLMVVKPMKLVIDNKGAVDYANTWSSGGRICFPHFGRISELGYWTQGSWWVSELMTSSLSMVRAWMSVYPFWVSACLRGVSLPRTSTISKTLLDKAYKVVLVDMTVAWFFRIIAR
jgi:hypothetical protein